jgi:hypothetical protein
MNKILLLFIIGLIGVGQLKSQSIYYATLGTTNTSSIWQLDLGNCTQTELFTGITPGINDFVETPIGFFFCSVLNSVTAQMYFFNSSTGSSTLVATNVSPLNLGITTQRLLLISPTKILWVIDARFYEFDITTNVTTLLADFPYSRSWALFTYNSQIYYVESPLSGSVSNIYTITLSPTLQRNLVISLQLQDPPETVIAYLDMATACNIPVSVSGNFNQVAYTYNMENYTSNIYCSWTNSLPVGGYATAPLLNDVTGPLCNCTTEAGTWDWTNLPIGLSFEVCVNGTITLPHNGDEILEPGQNLSFVLVDASAPSNTHFYDWLQGNIIHIYDSPVISYIPGVTEPNVGYRVYPVASNAPPGAINLDDACRDIQYPSPFSIMWKIPTVTFLPPNAAACTTGCQAVSLFFQGVPPFEMSYELIFDGGNPQVFNQTFTTNSSSIQVCPPPNFSGQIQINALSISDGDDCSCN